MANPLQKEPNMSVSQEYLNQAYDSEPWWYDLRGFLILTFAYRSTLGRQLRLFGKNMGQDHLEVAIGSGSLFELFLKWRRWKKLPNPQAVGVDYAERMLAGAYARLGDNDKVQLQRADVGDLPFESNRFDTINGANCVHCFSEIDKALKEIHRVLQPGGKFAGNCLLYPKTKGLLGWVAQKINQWGSQKGILHRPYGQTEFRNLLVKHGFKIHWEETRGNCYDFIASK